MEYIEITGKTVEDAITNATIKLSVTKDKLEYVVVDKGSTGFLGLNRKPAIIKARIKEEIDEFEQAIKGNVPEPKNEPKPVKKDEPKKENKPVKAEEPAPEKKPVVKPESMPENKPEPKQEVKSETNSEPVEDEYQDE
ncbi:MAG: Jag N-terminal domain-containing protein, partial [Lachnospiraceae bacterium]